MNEAVFFHGARDVRVAPINMRDDGSDEILIDVAAVGIAGATCTTTRMAASAPPSSVSRSFPVTSWRPQCEDVPELGLGEARSSSSIRTAPAGDANGVSKVAVICDRNATPFGRALPINTSNPRSTIFASGWSRPI